MIEASKHILKTDGVIGFFRGVTAMAIGAAPAHGLYFATYEVVKNALGANEAGHHPLATSVAGAAATTVSDFFQTPLDVIKQRLQLDTARYNGGVWRCMRRVYAAEGARAFWLSYPTTLVMNVPYHAAHFTIYEVAKKLLLHLPYTRSAAGDETAVLHLAAGAVAGGLASAVTTPLDVAKTRLQTQTETGQTYTSMRQTLRDIVTREGWRGLFAGVRPRVLFHMPSAGICWASYEFMKNLLDV